MLTKEQLEERKKGLGGSDSPVVLGVSPFKDRLTLWEEKVGLAPEVEATPAMKRGEVLEPIVADLYAEATGRKIVQYPETLQDEKYPFMLAHLDRVIDEPLSPGILEIKCPGLKVFSQCLREGVPDYYQVQLQHYLAVSENKWGALAIFNAERWELIFFDIQRDDELINIIRVKDAEFWQYVQEKEAPSFDAPQIDLPPVGSKEILKLESREWQKAVQRLREAKALKEEAEALEKDAIAKVQGFFDGVDVVEGSGARVYWRWQEGRKSIDGKRLKAEHPEVYEQYLKQGKAFRSFRPYFLKGGIEE